MSNLSKFLSADPRHADDIARLRRKITLLARFSDGDIERLYQGFSDACYSAGWITLDDDDERLDEFRAWLED